MSKAQWCLIKGKLLNSIESDQTLQNAASDQGLHFFLFNTGISIKHGNDKN